MDTIVAIATAPQNAAVGVIRLSGPDSVRATLHFFRAPSGKILSRLAERRMTYGCFVGGDGEKLDQCLVVYMPGPHSFQSRPP